MYGNSTRLDPAPNKMVYVLDFGPPSSRGIQVGHRIN
jgi:hypothetical protein